MLELHLVNRTPTHNIPSEDNEVIHKGRRIHSVNRVERGRCDAGMGRETS